MEPVESIFPKLFCLTLRITMYEAKGYLITKNLYDKQIGNEVLAVRFSNDENYLAAGTVDGTIKIYDVITNKLRNAIPGSKESLPITCLR